MSSSANGLFARIVALLFACVSLAACGDTGLPRFDLPLSGAGTAERTFTDGDWSVTLTRADVAFGPAYFCATTAADVDLCPVALAEFTGAAVVDALDDLPQELGALTVDAGTVRSATYDFGLTWLVTAQEPEPQTSALGGHSARFRGVAERADDQFEFALDIDVTSANAGDIAVRGAQTMQRLPGTTTGLMVRMDPAAWWQGVDYDGLFLEAQAEPGSVVRVDPSSPSAGVVRQGMTSRNAPTFEWSDDSRP